MRLCLFGKRQQPLSLPNQTQNKIAAGAFLVCIYTTIQAL